MPLSADSPLAHLMARFARAGSVRWIGLRPARDEVMQAQQDVEAVQGGGLRGDRYRGRDGGRGITLIQFEHLPVIASLAGVDQVSPALLRRNIAIEGIALSALVGQRFQLGTALLEATGRCDPCSRMEAALGEGGYNAMRGHGGITARVLEGGRIRIGDSLLPDGLMSGSRMAGSSARPVTH
jgi:MOSC domain-containing protein YiiM